MRTIRIEIPLDLSDDAMEAYDRFVSELFDEGYLVEGYEYSPERIHELVEMSSWDDVPAEDQDRLIRSLGRGPNYRPTDEELSALFNQWQKEQEGRT